MPTEDQLTWGIICFGALWTAILVRDIWRYRLLENDLVKGVRELLLAEDDNAEVLAYLRLRTIYKKLAEVDPTFATPKGWE